jgi:hypothetical protein
MKKVYTFVGDKVIIQTEQKLQLLVKNERSGNFLAMDEEGNLYSNDHKGMIDDLQKEDIRKNLDAWIRANGLIDAMLKLGVRKV